jgi:hypothetical protein
MQSSDFRQLGRALSAGFPQSENPPEGASRTLGHPEQNENPGHHQISYALGNENHARALLLSLRLAAVAPVLHPVLFDEFKKWFGDFGGRVTMADMRKHPEVQPIFEHAMLSGTLNGVTISLHENAQEIGGPQYWTLDLMHLGMHCIQMSIPRDRSKALGLHYGKGKSRRDIHNRVINTESLPDLVAYEMEAQGLILGWIQSRLPALEEPLRKAGMDAHEFMGLMRDFYAVDLAYFEHSVRRGEPVPLPVFMKALEKGGPEWRRFDEIRNGVKPIVGIAKIDSFPLMKLPVGKPVYVIHDSDSETSDSGTAPMAKAPGGLLPPPGLP